MHHPPAFRPALRFTRKCLLVSLAASLLFAQTGCINTMVMMTKVLLGDPVQISGFEQATGISLAKDKKSVLIYVSAPALVQEAFGTLTSDVEEELIRRMKRHEITVLHPDSAAKVLDRLGGTFDPQVLAREVKGCDYIMHIQLEKFSYKEESSPNFYRGNATGRIIGYEVRKETEANHAVQVFEQAFRSSYPTTYPVAVDSTPKNVFIRRFIDRLADNLGAAFYTVNRSELYAN
ncbi:hypothetical protein SH661x_004538 [Planctomicrobium sp. SH661]|uniref:hypothetical protein n=1 Tax=Planctomicrobium sp. SH661 TaxID=3448124 RepID=UPI003F5BC8C7